MENKKFYMPYIFFALLNCLLFILFYGKLGNFFIDISRELYVPFAMNNGAVLYKDIFNVYAPLGYQINSFFTFIFGNNLNTFYILGLFNSILVIFAIYSISNLLLKQSVSKSLAVFVITACCFTNSDSISNFILPYSYSMVYALNAFLWSLFCLLCYIKNSNKKYLYFSFFIFGISSALKYDFILYSVILLFFFFYKTTKKDKLFCLVSFLFVPLLSMLNLFIKGLNFSDIKSAIEYIILLSKSASVKYLYTFLGFIPSLSYLKIILTNIFYFSVSLFIILIPELLSYFSKTTTGIKHYVINFIKIPVTIVILLFLTLFYISNSAFIFCWSALSLFLILILFLLKKQINYETNDKIFLILLLSAILAGLKCVFNISFNTYGNYYLPFILICIITYICNYTSNNKTKKEALENLVRYCLLFFSCIYFISNFTNIFLYKTDKLDINKGIFYTDKKYSYVINKVCNYIKENTNKNDKILVLPDGGIINYITERLSDNKYYYLTPPNMEIFGSENIINDLKLNLPEYVVIQPTIYRDYGQTSFCKSYGKELCEFIYKNYTRQIYIQDDNSLFWMSIYKKNKYDTIR